MKPLSIEHHKQFLKILRLRFEKNMNRHSAISWETVETKLEKHPQKVLSLFEMEQTGGEPDIIGYDPHTDEFLFCDCAAESPKGRRSVCYDKEALNSRKEFKPTNNAVDMAASMGIELLTVEQYKTLQTFGAFDSKTSSWLKTPEDIRNLGGAIFGDFRYDTVFVYHNGASSYYTARGFRGILRV